MSESAARAVQPVPPVAAGVPGRLPDLPPHLHGLVLAPSDRFIRRDPAFAVSLVLGALTCGEFFVGLMTEQRDADHRGGEHAAA